MNQPTKRRSRVRIYIYMLLAVCSVIGLGAAYFAVDLYRQRSAMLKPSAPTIQKALPGFEFDAEEEARLAFIKAHTNRAGRVQILPARDDQIQIDPKLLEGIPAEKDYQPVPLTDLTGGYTETQFQQEREAWYRKHFVDEYHRAGQRDPRWDDAVFKFLDEAGRRVAVTRYRRLRHSRFYSDQFDNAHAAAGQAILDLGCKDILVRTLLIEELRRQGRHDEAVVIADLLQREFGPSPYSEFVQYQVAKSLIGAYGSKDLLARYTKHYRKSLASQTLTDLDRRILYEEGNSVIAAPHWGALPEFALSLEFQSNCDPWLRNMLLGDFYRTIATDSSMLAQSWNMYPTHLRSEPETIPAIHLGHLRRAYRHYLMAYKEQPDLPEAPAMLFTMSFQQSFTSVMVLSFDEEFRTLERLSEASPRYWFDQAVRAQFDYLPSYREFRAGRLPREVTENWKEYAELLNFGRECLDSQRFDTQVPLGFYDAVHTMIQHNEYVNTPPSERNRRGYAQPGLLEPFRRLVAGYEQQLSERETNYFRSLIVGMLWIQGKQDEAAKEFAALQSSISYPAFDEVYQDVSDIVRKLDHRELAPPEIANIDQMDVITAIPDSNRLLFVSGANLGAWDLEQHRFVDKYVPAPSKNKLPGHASFADGARYASVFVPPNLEICDTKTFEKVAELTLDGPFVSHRPSRSGKYVAVFTGDQVDLWEVAEKKRVQSIPLENMRSASEAINGPIPLVVRCFTFSEGDRLLAFVVGPAFEAPAINVDWPSDLANTDVNRLVVWDIEQQKMLLDDQPFAPNITALRFAESGSELLIGGTDWEKAVYQDYPFVETRQRHAIKRIDPLDPSKTRRYEGQHRPLWVPAEFGADKAFVVAASTHEFLVWDAATGEEVTSVYPVAGQLRLFTPLRQSGRIVSVDNSGRMNVFSDELRSGVRPILVTPDFFVDSRTRQIMIDPASRQVALRSQDSGGHVWRFDANGQATGHCVREFGNGKTTAHAFSSDLKWLATTPHETRQAMGEAAEAPSEISIWNVETSSLTRKLNGCTSAVVCAQFSQDAALLAAGLLDGNLLVWDLRTDSAEPINTYRDHLAEIQCMKFSVDGKYLVTGGRSGVALGKPFPPSIRIWDVDSEHAELDLLRKIEFTEPAVEKSGVQWLDIAADATAILASCAPQTTLFSFEGESKVTVPGFLGALHPDGAHFVTAGSNARNNAFTLWKVDGTRVRDFVGGHREPINGLTISPDGAVILSAAPSEGLVAWKTDSARRILYVGDLFKAP